MTAPGRRPPRHVRQDQRLVLDVLHLLPLQDGKDRGRRQLTELGVHGAEHRVGGHRDLVGRDGEEGAARHRVVRDEDGDLAAVALERVRDLGGGQDEPARRVDDEVDRTSGSVSSMARRTSSESWTSM
jgi:hypothetical protein